jgi:hypothetical protein
MDILEQAQQIAEREFNTSSRMDAACQVAIRSQKQAQHWRVMGVQEYHCHPGHLTWVVLLQNTFLNYVLPVMVIWNEEDREYLHACPYTTTTRERTR